MTQLARTQSKEDGRSDEERGGKVDTYVMMSGEGGQYRFEEGELGGGVTRGLRKCYRREGNGRKD